MSLAAGTRIGPYEIIGPLGAGGMGEVYRARDAKLNRDVAIKVVPELFSRDPERLARFEREAQALAALNHPNIAQIYGVVDTELVMELVEGEDLAQRLARGAIPVEDALPIARQIAEALEAAHERGIIHRDLKPANIKITPDGIVKILDFGLAKATDGRPDETFARGLSPASPTLTSPPMMTSVGSIVGTAAYMSPEQAKGRPSDKRSDVWAFGCVLFEMLTGRRPFGGETIAEMFASVLKSDAPWAQLPAATPLRVRELLRRCLEKEPRRRLQAIGEARAQLDEIIAGGGADAAVAVAAAPSRRPGGPFRILGIVAAVSALPLAIGVVVLLSRIASHQDPVARPIHFTVPYDEPFGGLAVSPDGTQLVFSAKQGTGTALYLRRFFAAEAEVLPGTTGAASPFWSPDSHSIGFFAAGRLRRFDVGGRAAQVVCPVNTSPGSSIIRGAWAADDTIVFLVSDGTMFQVPAAGGTPRQVTIDDGRSGASRFSALQVLPDSRRFLLQSPRSEFGGTFLGSLDKPGLTRISDGRVTFVAPDTFVVQREDSLATQRVDPASLAPVGPARSVQITGVGGISVSPAGALAYRSTISAETDLTWMDRNGRPQGTVGGIGNYYMPRISRDGSRVAFESHNASGTGDLHVFDLARGLASRITFDPTHHNAGAVWSPTGDRLLFHSTREGQSLYLKNTSGLGAEELVLKSDGANPTDWSPDGQVVLVDLNRASPRGIYSIAIGGDHQPRPVIAVPGFAAMQGQFSPDGKWLAYASNESGEFEIYLSPYPATGAKWQVSQGGGDSPRWNRNGKELFYLSGDQDVMAVPVTLGATAQSGKPQRLFQAAIRTRGTSDFSQYDVTPDGQRFLLVTLRVATAPLHVVVNWPALVRER